MRSFLSRDLNLNVKVSEQGGRMEIFDEASGMGFHIKGIPPTPQGLSDVLVSYLIQLAEYRDPEEDLDMPMDDFPEKEGANNVNY